MTNPPIQEGNVILLHFSVIASNLINGRVLGIKKAFDVNVYGVVNVTNAVLPYMRDRRSGIVVITGSRVAYRNEVLVRVSQFWSFYPTDISD